MISFRLRQFGEVSSTNDIVKAAISDGEAEGLAVCAESQTGGYGRRGNAWKSQPGGLYLSLLLRPDKPVEEIQTLSLLAAIAVRRVVASFLSENVSDAVKIKWPNDVVVMEDGLGRSGRDGVFDKICGISVEQKGGAVCVGIGVNVHAPQGSKAACLACLGDDDTSACACADGPSTRRRDRPKNNPVYMCDLECRCTLSIEAVRDKLLVEFAKVYDEWKARSFEAFRAEFLEHFALEGFKVRIDESGLGGPVRCEVRDVNTLGHLLVLPEGEKELREIAAGTVVIEQ